ncbi:hypothetical protein D3C71_2163150 [compost metagenome]
MLRNGDNYPTARSQSLMHRMQNHFVFSDVFNDVVSADDVKCILGHYFASIHLHELSIFPETLGSNGKP